MKELIFVYNADASLFGQITDFTHKIISPETYQCNLCKLTYGNFGIKAEWKQFIETIDAKLTFLHRDEFQQMHPESSSIELPAIFNATNLTTPIISSEQINKAKSLDQLIELINTQIK